MACQNMAMEGATFVLVATQLMTEGSLEALKCAGDPVFKSVGLCFRVGG